MILDKWPTWLTILFYMYLFHFSTCFEQPRAHHQENQLYQYNIWYMSLCFRYYLHRPVANLSCFQKGASYSGIRIFNSLPQSITNLKKEKTQFKVALKKILNAHSFYSVDEFFTCTDDMNFWLYDCVNMSYIVIFFIVFMFMTCSTSYCLVTLKDLWNEYMYVCMYVSCAGRKVPFRLAHETVTDTEWHTPNFVLMQLILLMMSTRLLETFREFK